MDKKAIIEALSQDDAGHSITEVVHSALAEMSKTHRILAEALLRQNAENMIRFQQMFDRQQQVIDRQHALVESSVNAAFTGARTASYATVARGRPSRVAEPQPSPRVPSKPSPGPTSGGPAVFPPVPDAEPFEDDKEERLPEHDDEVVELIARTDGPPPLRG